MIYLHLDFDLTQIKGHLHNAVMKALYRENYPDHPSPPKVYTLMEVLGILNDSTKEMPEQVKAWLDRIIEIEKIHFFDSELLGQKLTEYKDIGIHINVLTASNVSGAIEYMYEKHNLYHLIDRLTSVSTENPDEKKALHIQEREDSVLKKDKNASIASIFVDDSDKNMNRFNEIPSRTGVTRMGIQVDNKGLSKDIFDRIDDFLKIEKKISENYQAKKGSLYVNTPKAIEEATLEATTEGDILLKSKQLVRGRGTVYVNTPEAVNEATLEATTEGDILLKSKQLVRGRGTVYVNTPEAVNEATLEAAAEKLVIRRRGVRLAQWDTPEEIEEASKEMGIDDTTLKSSRVSVSLHFGDITFDEGYLKGSKHENLRCEPPKDEPLSPSKSKETEMSEFTKPRNELAPKVAVYAAQLSANKQKAPTSKPETASITRKGGVRKK